MLQPDLSSLDILSTPIWIVTPGTQEIVLANRAAREISGSAGIEQMRHGALSAQAHSRLEACLPALAAKEQVVEIWTVRVDGEERPLSCRLSLLETNSRGCLLVVEGQGLPAPLAHGRGRQAAGDAGFYEQLFRTSSAPMLLIDPAREGRIVDANLAAFRFYGYTSDEMRRMHTWEINQMGRDVLPVMYEVAKLPGGHKPLNFLHRLADGSTRHVQTYAGPVERDGKRLMLCTVHDITEQKRLEQQLEQAALRDPLTGLWNRRQFLQLVDRAQSQFQRYGCVFSLLLVDADHFKTVNDRYGHHAGDDLLILLADTLESRARECDSVCRWGGEEFVVLLPQTHLEGALHLAESIRATVEGVSRSGLPPVTVSIGVAQIGAGEDPASLFRRADAALYEAKTAGRNRVKVAGPSPEATG